MIALLLGLFITINDTEKSNKPIRIYLPTSSLQVFVLTFKVNVSALLSFYYRFSWDGSSCTIVAIAIAIYRGIVRRNCEEKQKLYLYICVVLLRVVKVSKWC